MFTEVSPSSQSAIEQIAIERYPELGNRQQISTGGGTRPFWSRDGGELFFGSLDSRQMLAVAVQSGATLVAGRSFEELKRLVPVH